MNKLTHLVVAGAAAFSLGAVAADDKQEPQAQSGQIKQAQQKLSSSGHDIGEANGKMGPKTQAALKKFQQSKGLQASGKLDQQTSAALDISGDASVSTKSSAEKSSVGVSDGAPSAGSSAERTAEPKSASGEHEAAQPTGEKPKY